MKRFGKSETRRTRLAGKLTCCFVLRPLALVIAATMLSAVAIGLAEQTNAPARLTYDSFRMISDRNIFNPNRYARSAGRTRTESRPASRVESFTLVGLMAYEKGVFAFFDGTSASYKKTLEGAGTISEFKITSVTPDQARLVSGTNEFVLHVGMQVRREDEGDWFLTEAGQTTRNRVVVSRGRSRSSTSDAAGMVEGAADAGTEGQPEIIVVEPESTTETPEANGNGEGAAPAAEPANANGVTDPVLLRLMQRRQELSQ